MRIVNPDRIDGGMFPHGLRGRANYRKCAGGRSCRSIDLAFGPPTQICGSRETVWIGRRRERRKMKSVKNVDMVDLMHQH
jgi:hypothetical protein